MAHNFRSQDFSIAHRPGHYPVNEKVKPADHESSDTAGHHWTEHHKVPAIVDSTAPGIGNYYAAHPFRVTPGKAKPNSAAPVRQIKGDILKLQVVQQSGEVLRMGLGMTIIRRLAALGRAEADMVGSDAPELFPQPADRAPKLERPCGIAMHEYDWFPLAFVDLVHTAML